MGSDSASSAQSKRGDVGNERDSGTEVNGLLRTDVGCKTGPVAGTDALITPEDTRVGETARLWGSRGKAGGIGVLAGVDGERVVGLGSLGIVLPCFDNGGCSSCWGILFAAEYRCWGPSSSLSVDNDVPRLSSGLRIWGTGGGIGDDMAALGNAGGGETTRWGVTGVVLGGVYGLGSFLGRGSSFMGEGWVGGAGLGDLIAVRPFFVNVGGPSLRWAVLGAEDDRWWPSYTCTTVIFVLETSWLQTIVVAAVWSFFVNVGVCSSSGGSVCRAAHRRSGGVFVCTANPSVLGVICVVASLQVVVPGSVWTPVSSKKAAPQKRARIWAAIDRQSPMLCSSMVRHWSSLSLPTCTPFSVTFSSLFLLQSSPLLFSIS